MLLIVNLFILLIFTGCKNSMRSETSESLQSITKLFQTKKEAAGEHGSQNGLIIFGNLFTQIFLFFLYLIQNNIL